MWKTGLQLAILSVSLLTRKASAQVMNNDSFRSLNTRKPPSKDLYERAKDCMVSYSSATTDDSVGRVGPIALNKVFATDDSRSWRRKSEQKAKARSQFIKQMSITDNPWWVIEMTHESYRVLNYNHGRINHNYSVFTFYIWLKPA